MPSYLCMLDVAVLCVLSLCVYVCLEDELYFVDQPMSQSPAQQPGQGPGLRMMGAPSPGSQLNTPAQPAPQQASQQLQQPQV